MISLLAAIAGCGARVPEPTFYTEGRPERLSEWGMLGPRGDQLVLGRGVEPYSLNASLFTDYAGKLRTIWLPPGTAAGYREGEILDFPVGTVITKTFYYPVGDDGHLWRGDGAYPVASAPETLDMAKIRLIETRLLVHREQGWVAFPYVWSKDQSDAQLVRIGHTEAISLKLTDGDVREVNYAVPNVNQCAGCHATNHTSRELQPIGPAPRHLNREAQYAEGSHNQLLHLRDVGYLVDLPAIEDIPRLPAWDATEATLDDRARAYLDINCGHCHNPVGAADTSGLHLNHSAGYGPHLGVCKPPIAAGPGSGGLRFGIVPGDPDASILLYRMAASRSDVMMPELGRSLVHTEGVALISAWIATLRGSCGSDRIATSIIDPITQRVPEPAIARTVRVTGLGSHHW